LTWNTKYVPENTSEQALEKMSTYASIRVKFAPSVYTDGDGKIKVHENAVDDFWVVMLDGVVYYFDDQDEADAFAGKNGATVSETYASGYCYYNAFINSKKGSNVERNTFYNAKISLIVPPGSPTPEVQNPDDTVREPTNIKVSIDIEEWTYEEEEYPLS
ncbi:MAG: fimbria major subunit, partial [Odoribacteraceae bacterium]|jgi:hypothetical protein|nr:fimbria major subunit [Odoribacteraceae bacterium]